MMKNYSYALLFAALLAGISCQNFKDHVVEPELSGVFVSGYYDDQYGNPVAAYWKDGTKVLLSDKFSQTNGMMISGNSLYISGTETGGKAKYWKDNTAVDVTDGTKPASAAGIFVSGKDVYIAGLQSDGGIFDSGKYWKNGVPQFRLQTVPTR